jgi:hypothetical protein
MEGLGTIYRAPTEVDKNFPPRAGSITQTTELTRVIFFHNSTTVDVTNTSVPLLTNFFLRL